jgi:hypothetical protein
MTTWVCENNDHTLPANLSLSSPIVRSLSTQQNREVGWHQTASSRTASLPFIPIFRKESGPVCQRTSRRGHENRTVWFPSADTAAK